MAHLENPRLTSDLSMARDFDLAITGPLLFIEMDFIAAGDVEMIGGRAAAGRRSRRAVGPAPGSEP